LQSGLRMEQTNSEGDLTNADGITQPDDTVKRSYLDLFPSAAISYNLNDKNTFGLTYSRRIDRPNYQDLNPFENKLDQLTYQKGNAFLRPQYTDNIELSHTFDSKLITTIGYSHVKDYATQVTDTTNGNATYVQQQNIATQKILSINIGSPLTIKKWWNGYANIWYNYQFVKGAYNNIVVNIQAPSYGAYMQNSFTLGKDYTAEVSGWVNGPGLDGTWQAKALGGVDMGIQKLLFKKKATIKLSATDVLHTVTYYGSSNYGGTSLNIRDRYENQTIRLNFSYRFGSSQIKAARQHKTGLESESNRIKN
jgi:iron complex outermembrane receptor protein